MNQSINSCERITRAKANTAHMYIRDEPKRHTLTSHLVHL